MWLLVAGGAGAAYFHFNNSISTSASSLNSFTSSLSDNLASAPEKPVVTPGASAQTTSAQSAPPQTQPARSAVLHPVQVVITAHDAAWVQMTVDGKIAFTGILKTDEIKEIDGGRASETDRRKRGRLDHSAERKNARTPGTCRASTRGQADGGRSAVPREIPAARARSALAARRLLRSASRLSASRTCLLSLSAISNSCLRLCLVRISTLRQNLLK